MNNHIVLDVSLDEDDDKRDNFSNWLDEFLQVSDEKPKSSNSSDPMVEIKEEDDDDCVILDSDPMAKDTVIDTIETDEVLVLGKRIACRDFPHPRHDCAKYQFKSTLHQKYCEMCHCYVCDTRAPCPYWYSGSSSVDHCHANDKEEIWRTQREWIMTGNMLPRPASIIAQMGRVTRPRSVPISQNSSSPLTQFGVRACSTSTKVATQPNTYTRPGYRTEQSGAFPKYPVSQACAVQSYPNHRDVSYNVIPSPKKAVSSSPYTYRRPSRRVYRPGSGVQNIAQGSQATHYPPSAASQATRTTPPPALQATRTAPLTASQAGRNAPPVASQATRTAPPTSSQATRTAPLVASQATRYAPPPALQATHTAPPAVSQDSRNAPPVASQATRYAPPTALQATRTASPAASQAGRNAPPVASQATRYAPPAASQATCNAPPVASQASHYTPPVASQPTRSAPPPASLGNPQRIVTDYISTVPESPRKVYARHFNQKMYSANLQTNAVPSESHNPLANQRQQQSERSNDKVLSKFEDWLLNDSTPAGPPCPLFGQDNATTSKFGFKPFLR